VSSKADVAEVESVLSSMPNRRTAAEAAQPCSGGRVVMDEPGEWAKHKSDKAPCRAETSLIVMDHFGGYVGASYEMVGKNRTAGEVDPGGCAGGDVGEPCALLSVADVKMGSMSGRSYCRISTTTWHRLCRRASGVSELYESKLEEA
jgi:hypothetical protein